MQSQLTPEERYLWQCARAWRRPQPAPAAIDWQRVVQLGLKNRMGPLLQRVLLQSGDLAHLPAAAQRELQRDVDLQGYRARLFARELRRFLSLADERRLPLVVIKGLWLSLKIYGQANARPGGDVDLLLRRQDVRAALNVLDYQMHYGRWWRPLLDDAYYARHHLHQQRCIDGRAVWFEPHWRLDHPYTTLTIDYEAMMARSAPATLLGHPVRELAPPDLLLTLVVHLAKHALYLTSAIERPDLPRVILADGMLVYFLDVAEVLRHYGDRLDWDCVVSRAGAAGAAPALGAVLRVCARDLQAPVPPTVLQALPVPPPDAITQRVLQGMVTHLLNVHEGRRARGPWAFLSGFQETIIFRPIRLLDLLRYCLPGADYLQRRYGSRSPLTAAWHLLRALAQYARLGLDTAFYTWRRARRLRRLNPEELDRCDARYDPLLDEAEMREPLPA